MEILYSQRAAKQLKGISTSDRESAVRIVKTIESYATNPTAKFDIKVLKGKMALFRRLQVGKYRIIFEEGGTAIHVLQVRHRRESYQ